MHVVRLVARRPRRSLGAGLGAAIAAALLVSIILFGAASGATVTRRALAGVPIDAQLVVAPGGSMAEATGTATADPAVSAVLPFDLVHFDDASLDRAGTATQTSSGVLVGLDAGYQAATGLFAIAQGAARPGEMTVSRDLATNLGARPGDQVAFRLPGGASVALTISGIVDITGADQVLGPVDAAHRSAGGNSPTNVAVLDRASLVSLVEARIPAGTPMTVPGATTGGDPVSTIDAAVVHELHLRYDHALMPGDPLAAQTWLDQVRRRLELQGTGGFAVADDASAALTPIVGDLAWGQILFVFLGLPGIILAFLLARLSSQSGTQGIRRHVSLLRARGATGRQLALVLVGAEGCVAMLGALVGAVAGTAIALAMFGSELASIDPLSRIGWTWVLVIPLTTLLAVLAASTSLRRLITETVATGRQEVQRLGRPLWQRLYLDVALIAAALVTYVLVSAGGVHPAVNAEGNPTVSLALGSFLAPLLFWLGGSLLLLRAAGLFLRRSGRAAGLLGHLLGPGGGLAAPSLASRAATASRLVVLIALSVSFAVSISLFSATYLQQQRIDAELTLGADLKATPDAPTDVSGATAVKAAGAESVTPFAQKVVYVGSEAQDLLAIDPSTLGGVSPLGDGFFPGTSASGAMAALRQVPDGVLVSSETATDYSIVPGDHLKIRVPGATGTLHDVEFEMVGVALEFPTAPQDAFLVANLAYVTDQVSDPRISFVLGRAGSDAQTAAIGERLGQAWRVEGLSTVTARLANGITSVDLHALVVIDIAFAILIASVAAAMFVLAGVADRARELAALQALGAEPNQVRAMLAGEIGTVGLAGVASGLAIGLLLGVVLLTILAGIFDPPADAPSVPWDALLVILAAAVAGLGIAYLLASRYATRMLVMRELRER